MIKFVNLTPHTIHLPNLTVEPSGEVARVEAKTSSLGTLHGTGVEVSKRTFGEIEGLPDQKGVLFDTKGDRVFIATGISDGGYADRVIYIVSALVLAAVPNRSDVAAPDTGESAIRDADGRILGVTQLIMNYSAFLEDEDCAF